MFTLFQFDWLSSVGLAILVIPAYLILWFNAEDMRLAFKSAVVSCLAVILVVESMMRVSANLGAVGL